MLTFRHVEFSYINQVVFTDLNLHLGQGEFVFLIGKSGSGKTTLLQMIYMNLFPSSGSVQIGDYSSETVKEKDLPFLRRKLGVIFQDFKLIEGRTVFENLAFVLQVTGTPKKIIKKKVISALSDVGLSHKQNVYPNQLSGGEQQRVSIARAIINEPMLVLADEPTGNLDPETSAEILEIIKKINRRTHNYELVKKTEAKIFKLSDGKAVNVKLKKRSEKS